MTDFNSEAAAHRGRQLYAARLKATAQLAEAEADNNVEYAAEQIQTIANIDQEGEPPYQPAKLNESPTLEHEDYEPPSERKTRSIVSAPVSREYGYSALQGGSGGERSGKVHMTPAMKESARISGLTELEYAEQVIELRRRKSEGDYGGSP
jgi:hypothetical protein